MQVDEAITKKIEALALLTHKTPEAILHEALDGYMETQQKKLMEDELVRRQKETTLSYDEFWDGVDL